MKKFVSAIQFITTLPAGKAGFFDPDDMAPFFPLVGLLCGFILLLCDQVFISFWPVPVASLLDVLVMIMLTGAFHLDGLSDSADGLLSHRGRDRMLAIMKDSRIGAMGMIVTVSVLAVKWAGISTLDDHRSLFLFLIPAYSRGSMLFGMKFLPYGRPENGIGKDLFDRPMGISFFRFLALPLLLSLFCGFRGMVLNISYAILIGLILLYYKKRLGCITGDMLGAMTETTEAFLFLLVAGGLV
ncbi:MAG: adenosylcobinamide-GDP ribazoletransferase [Proteobacteria bacterium]|nr:adenosylcobinamide-GDP ribazoletransferase [Pseudomonadota bacterium]